MKETPLLSLKGVDRVCRALIPIVGSKILCQHNSRTKILVLNKITWKKENKSKKLCKRKHKRFYPSSVLVTYIQSLSNPLEIFLILDFVHPKSTPVHHWTKHPLPHLYNSSYTKKTITSCTISLQPEDTLVQPSLWVITINPISLEICMWSWTRTLIGGLSEFFTKGLEFVWRTENGTSFLKTEYVNRVWTENYDFNWCV